MSSYKLRPHHGLCLHFFRGRGYSEDFVQNMLGIQTALAQNPDVQLVEGADQVCAACQHRVGGTGCEAQEKVARYDAAVLERCGYQVGEILRWRDFSAKITEAILTQNGLQEICADCEWYSICSHLVSCDYCAK
ncbi:MAG: DUF1284 domain-containing protein [Faecalibacterium sp.]